MLLKVHRERGQPSLHEKQPELLETIVKLVTFGASAEARRRNESLVCCKTIKQLRKELIDLGYKISETALYYRLMSKNPNTRDGRRNVTTVPVRFSQAQLNLHKNHQDQSFCTAIIRSLETIASILGPNHFCQWMIKQEYH